MERGLLKGIADIYRLGTHHGTLVEVEGLGEKSVQNLLDAIKASKDRPLSRVLAAINIPHVGPATADQLADRFGAMSALQAAEADDIHAALSTPSLKEKRTGETAKKVPQAIHAFLMVPAERTMINDLQELGVNLTQPKSPGAQGPLAGKTVVVTGTLERFTRSEIHARIKDLGGKVGSSVSKKTDLVVVGVSAGRKAEEARALNVPTIDESTFLSEYGEE
ncbi:MAG: hypothetical protein IID39_07435 [Planctomycetes bacterium]|nr:hypothetical protein [Planctomycetota bacterium]